MGHTFLAGTAPRVGHIPHQVQRQQRFNQTNRRQNHRVRQDDVEGLKRERGQHRAVKPFACAKGNMRHRETAFDRGQIAHTRHIHAREDHHSSHNPNASQGGGDHFGDARHDPDDCHRSRHQRQHQIERPAGEPFTPAHAMTCVLHGAGHLELAHLRQENHDGQPVHKAQHHRMRHQPDKLAPLHDPRKDLQQPHQNDSGKKVLDPMLGHQSHHDHRQSAGRARDHARPPPDQGCDQAHQKGCIEPHQRMHPCDKGKSHRFRHQCQCNGEARQQLNPQPPRREPITGHPTQIGDIEVLCKAAECGARHQASFLKEAGLTRCVVALAIPPNR